jgi:hypothetical protein
MPPASVAWAISAQPLELVSEISAISAHSADL